jgi:hypothetical protein
MEIGGLTYDAKSFVSILFQLKNNVVEVEIGVVFGDRFGILEFKIIGVTDYFTDGEGVGGSDEKIFVDKFNEIF